MNRIFVAIKTLAHGVAMGLVELIPGVSGGTMALILGIYSDLIRAIDSTFSWIGNSLRCLVSVSKRPTRPKEAPPFLFLFLLVVGMAAALLSGSHIVSELLRSVRGLTYAFFFGLVLASVTTPLRLMKRRGMREALIVVTGAVVSFVVTGLAAGVEREPGLPLLLLSGALSVVVLVLPGVSGSFVLLSLGSYSYVVDQLRGVTSGELTEAVLPLATFALGMVIGLATVVRLISFLFARYQSLTLAALSGLMLGSLRALWPFFIDGKHLSITELGSIGVGIIPLIAMTAAGASTILVLTRVVRRQGRN